MIYVWEKKAASHPLKSSLTSGSCPTHAFILVSCLVWLLKGAIQVRQYLCTAIFSEDQW